MLNKALTNISIYSKKFLNVHSMFQTVLGGNIVVDKGKKSLPLWILYCTGKTEALNGFFFYYF